MKQKGYVQYAGSNTFKGKVLHSFRLRDVEKWFGTGLTDPKLQKNELIEFDYEESNGRNNVDVGSIKRVDLNAPSDSVPIYAKNPPGAKSEYQLKDEYWRAKEKRDIENEGDRKLNQLRIQFQSARNAAIAVVDILVRDKLLKLSDSAKADNVAVVLGKIQDLTTEFYETTSMVGEVTDQEIPFEPAKETF